MAQISVLECARTVLWEVDTVCDLDLEHRTLQLRVPVVCIIAILSLFCGAITLFRVDCSGRLAVFVRRRCNRLGGPQSISLPVRRVLSFSGFFVDSRVGYIVTVKAEHTRPQIALASVA